MPLNKETKRFVEKKVLILLLRKLSVLRIQNIHF